MTTVSSTAVPPEAQAMQMLLQIGTGHFVASALQVVLKLEIADRLVAGAADVSDLARDAAVNEDALYRVMRARASVGLFDEQAPRRFALTAAGAMLSKGPGTFRDLGLFITGPVHFRVYADMLHAVTTGAPAIDKVMGVPLFEYHASHPEWGALFNNAMTSLSATVIPAVLEVYDFGGIGTLVDVAGGHGQVLTTLLSAYPRMQGVLFDLPHVVAGAGPLIEAAGVAGRCRVEGGDFFAAMPRGDAYILKHIIHDWDDARATTILQHIRAALDDAADGRLILVESVLRPGNEPDFGKILDLEMLVLPGGRERTAEEFRSLLAGAGFTLTHIAPTKSPVSVIEARPARR